MDPSFLSVKNFILDLIFPVFCLNCKQEGGWLCPVCIKQIKFNPPTCFVCKKISWPVREDGPVGRTCKNCAAKTHIYAFLSPLSYRGPAQDLIHYLKYRRIRSISSLLAGLVVDYIRQYKIFLPQDLIIVPIPLHKSRLAERGFNQAELMGGSLSAALGLKMETKLLIKQQKTRPQMELSGEERKKNLSGVFNVPSPEKIKNRSFILLDDVKTTGSTLEEAALVLKQARAKKVWAMTAAH